MTAGLFISLEGPDGAGKTSVLNALLERVEPLLGERLLVTREPGGNNNQVAEAIREVVLSPELPTMDPMTEALLIAAARREHVTKTIRPALAAGKVVLTDRYVDSSIAYQGGGRELGVQEVSDINAYAIEGLMPKATIYLDLDPAVGLARIQNTRQDEVNRLDVEALSFHERVTGAYRELVKANPERFHVIDASQPLADVIESAWETLQRILATEED
ncbi:dTMP kinase [Weissella ceti]|uniref:Thymidylate kinase n=1 Tax=Weissella ceti TaxID=759620 RepID=A0ABT3E4L5_9LACO|nr:dTMP kinase [Weissella ceti]MCW0953337.1 dTMP kinase [Weissella ceti]QVK11942.1 dTMP kinase [Weissella ceti]